MVLKSLFWQICRFFEPLLSLNVVSQRFCQSLSQLTRPVNRKLPKDHLSTTNPCWKPYLTESPQPSIASEGHHWHSRRCSKTHRSSSTSERVSNPVVSVVCRRGSTASNAEWTLCSRVLWARDSSFLCSCCFDAFALLQADLPNLPERFIWRYSPNKSSYANVDGSLLTMEELKTSYKSGPTCGPAATHARDWTGIGCLGIQGFVWDDV
jgi:hypothetical protein